jgi:hypothetical protein
MQQTSRKKLVKISYFLFISLKSSLGKMYHFWGEKKGELEVRRKKNSFPLDFPLIFAWDKKVIFLARAN